MKNTNDDIEQASNSKSPNDDQSMILQALNSVGSSAYGIVSISVWSLNESSSHLIQHGFWVDPIFRRESTSDALEMLIDERRMDYAPARPLIPGEGLEGVLFSECINTIRVRTSHIKRSSILFDQVFQCRILKHILDDDDQPYNRRLSLLVEAQIGKAIGFPFHNNSIQGIVVYMTREKLREEDILTIDCVQYLLNSTKYISGLLLFLLSRRIVKRQIQDHLSDVLHRLRGKLLAVYHLKNYQRLYETSIDNYDCLPMKKIKTSGRLIQVLQHDCILMTRKRVHAWVRKCKGGNVPLPPPKSWASLRFTFCAVYTQLFILYWVDDFIVKYSYGKFSLQRGTLGSNVSSLFSLTTSPASQPRPLIIGQLICVSISLIFKYFKCIPKILRITVGGALSTTILARLGLTTPSATALSMTFAYDTVGTQKSGWISLAILCFQTMLSLLLATALNNISSKRQYPTSWMTARR